MKTLDMIWTTALSKSIIALSNMKNPAVIVMTVLAALNVVLN